MSELMGQTTTNTATLLGAEFTEARFENLAIFKFKLMLNLYIILHNTYFSYSS